MEKSFKIDTIYNENCLDTMARMPEEFVDLIVTSPPYDNLRKYKNVNWNFDIFKEIAHKLYEVLKTGRILVWVVGDATVQGNETGTSFKQALYFKDVVGFNLHDTMIYHKNNPMPCEIGKRYQPAFEYMFVLSKGKIKVFNPIKIEALEFGKKKIKRYTSGNRQTNGSSKPFVGKHNCNKMKFKHNVWTYNVQYGSMSKQKIAHKHPAIFPEQLAKDHIISWSNPKDLVYDPFMGSGTTIVACVELNRHYIGSEISKEYYQISKERLND